MRVQGQWRYLYRAIDRNGNLVDVRLSDTRDLAAAAAFFHTAWTVIGVIRDRITADGHDAYPRASRNVFGKRVLHRTNRYLNNHLEQDHRGIKQRYRPMGGFKTLPTAVRFCCLFDDIRALFRPQSHRCPRHDWEAGEVFSDGCPGGVVDGHGSRLSNRSGLRGCGTRTLPSE